MLIPFSFAFVTEVSASSVVPTAPAIKAVVNTISVVPSKFTAFDVTSPVILKFRPFANAVAVAAVPVKLPVSVVAATVPDAVISVAAISPVTESVVVIAGLVESVNVPATELKSNDAFASPDRNFNSLFVAVGEVSLVKPSELTTKTSPAKLV